MMNFGMIMKQQADRTRQAAEILRRSIAMPRPLRTVISNEFSYAKPGSE